MRRVTQAQLETLTRNLNKITGNPLSTYREGENGRPIPQGGNYHLDQAYGGVKLVQMVEGGGCRTISPNGYGTKRQLFDYLHAYMDGMAANKNNS